MFHRSQALLLNPPLPPLERQQLHPSPRSEALDNSSSSLPLSSRPSEDSVSLFTCLLPTVAI